MILLGDDLVAGVEQRHPRIHIGPIIRQRSNTPIQGDPGRIVGKALAQRASREPLQYITGRQEFYGLAFHVAPGVLVPRPETEVLAERAWQFLGGLAGAPEALDIGTGSGCIAISIERDPTAPLLIHSVRGFGYTFEPRLENVAAGASSAA